MAAPEILSGLAILEIAEGVAGPMCGKVLRDLGARSPELSPRAATGLPV